MRIMLGIVGITAVLRYLLRLAEPPRPSPLPVSLAAQVQLLKTSATCLAGYLILASKPSTKPNLDFFQRI